eukprot:CAMPEP_0115505188 /NCGR_PEP_ID=MMETSP0271-20121206/70425_1 /TAXON_ID=71861 /ORGANISM="Scrippsiella trochoidea, Strain CCMP3099" /LENGTH=184 /DNA_ID=CAMNT_0002934427 /DNA_START=17 /DNA_END=572 /DNA_ORIENTATION=+
MTLANMIGHNLRPSIKISVKNTCTTFHGGLRGATQVFDTHAWVTHSLQMCTGQIVKGHIAMDSAAMAPSSALKPLTLLKGADARHQDGQSATSSHEQSALEHMLDAESEDQPRNQVAPPLVFLLGLLGTQQVEGVVESLQAAAQVRSEHKAPEGPHVLGDLAPTVAFFSASFTDIRARLQAGAV